MAAPMSLGLQMEIAHHVKARTPRSRVWLGSHLQGGPGSWAGREEGRGQAQRAKLDRQHWSGNERAAWRQYVWMWV